MLRGLLIGCWFALAVGPLVAHFGLVRPMVGFGLFGLGGLLAAVAGVWGAIRFFRVREDRGFARAAITTGAVVLLGFGIALGLGRGKPRINDISTDLADPPRFFAGQPVPGPYPPEFAEVQRGGYGDLQPLQVAGTPIAALEKARATAKRLGWTVVQYDAVNGRLQATDRTFVFRFVDDIVVRVQPAAHEKIQVDVRSKSRDGKGDMGKNAARIRAFLDAFPKE